MGLPYFKMKEIYAQYGIQARSSNYELYADISRRVMSVLADFTPNLEPYSIDEAFMRLSLPHGDNYIEYGHKIKERVDKWVGIPVSVGIAPTKTLAKIGTHIAKKSGIGVYQMPEEPSHILAKLPLEEIWGIGSRLACKLRALGIKTAGELAQQDTAMIRRKFSVCLARTILELNGQPALEPEELETKSQSICCSRALGRNQINYTRQLTPLMPNSAETESGC